MAEEETSSWYWLLPILFNWIGGLTGWLALKDKDDEKANKILIGGLVVLGVEVFAVLAFVASLMI